MEDKGLDEHGHIRREGDVELVQSPFRGLLAHYLDSARAAFDTADLDGVYAYGSIMRGAARARRSDFDGQILLTREPTAGDRSRIRELEDELTRGHPEVTDVGILIESRERMTSPEERFDGGFQIRVLCTPLWGEDAGVAVEPHRPDLQLARRVQGDWVGAIERLRARADTMDPAHHCRTVGRRLTRIAFTWVMPQWRGWSSDPAVLRGVVSRYEPSWGPAVTLATELGWQQRVDSSAARHLLDGFADALIERGRDLGAG